MPAPAASMNSRLCARRKRGEARAVARAPSSPFFSPRLQPAASRLVIGTDTSSSAAAEYAGASAASEEDASTVLSAVAAFWPCMSSRTC